MSSTFQSLNPREQLMVKLPSNMIFTLVKYIIPSNRPKAISLILLLFYKLFLSHRIPTPSICVHVACVLMSMNGKDYVNGPLFNHKRNGTERRQLIMIQSHLPAIKM